MTSGAIRRQLLERNSYRLRLRTNFVRTNQPDARRTLGQNDVWRCLDITRTDCLLDSSRRHTQQGSQPVQISCSEEEPLCADEFRRRKTYFRHGANLRHLPRRFNGSGGCAEKLHTQGVDLKSDPCHMDFKSDSLGGQNGSDPLSRTGHGDRSRFKRRQWPTCNEGRGNSHRRWKLTPSD